jgi:Cu(I)/Ag(I) efflux system membrane fusion protein
MNSVKWGIALLAVAILGAVAGYGWATRATRRASAAPTIAAPAMSATDTRRILYYHDPMRPEVKFDRPGKSPFMDMELVPVYADGMDAGGVAVSGNAQQSLGMRVGHVKKVTVAPQVVAVGSVMYDEHAIAVVQARAAGYVAHLYVRAAMDRVHPGQILAAVTVPAWIAAEGEYAALLRSDSPSIASLREAARQRLGVLGIPGPAIAELEKTRQVPAATALVAPVAGVVTELGLREGASFEQGALLFRINGTATVWVNAQVPEAQANAVVPGSLVETHTTAKPSDVLKGRVLAVLPEIDPITRTVRVRIAVDNAAGKLSPGMFVQSVFKGAAGTPRLWVPSEAVIATGTRTVVIRKGDGGSFDVVNVTPGIEADGKTEIRSGLAEGDAIVLSGQFLIDSEAGLKSAVNRLTSSATTTPESLP